MQAPPLQLHHTAITLDIIQLLHAVTGSMAFSVLYTQGGKWHPRQSRGCHLPPRVYKTHGPQSRKRATVVLLYLLGNIVIPLLKALFIFKHY